MSSIPPLDLEIERCIPMKAALPSSILVTSKFMFEKASDPLLNQ
jgi:hypothetical protein